MNWEHWTHSNLLHRYSQTNNRFSHYGQLWILIYRLRSNYFRLHVTLNAQRNIWKTEKTFKQLKSIVMWWENLLQAQHVPRTKEFEPKNIQLIHTKSIVLNYVDRFQYLWLVHTIRLKSENRTKMERKKRKELNFVFFFCFRFWSDCKSKWIKMHGDWRWNVSHNSIDWFKSIRFICDGFSFIFSIMLLCPHISIYFHFFFNFISVVVVSQKSKYSGPTNKIYLVQDKIRKKVC